MTDKSLPSDPAGSAQTSDRTRVEGVPAAPGTGLAYSWTSMPFKASRRNAGFSLVEFLIIFAVIVIMLLLGMPTLRSLIIRSRLEGIARQTGVMMQRARMESVRRGVPVVVRADYDQDDLFAFADVNDNGGNPTSNLKFDPVAGADDRAADYPVLRMPLPVNLSFWAATDGAAEGPDAIDGFTPVAGETLNVAVFEPDGSIRDRGAIVFADDFGNFLEVRVEPEATAHVQVRKYNPDIPAGPDGSMYHPPGKTATGDPAWVWYR